MNALIIAGLVVWALGALRFFLALTDEDYCVSFWTMGGGFVMLLAGVVLA